MDVYQGNYKDGTNNTRDYRYFSGVFFLAILIFTMKSYVFPSSLCMETQLKHIVKFVSQFLTRNTLFANRFLQLEHRDVSFHVYEVNHGVCQLISVKIEILHFHACL